MKKLFWLLPFALLACSSGDDFAVCSANETQACVCPGDEKGAQVCDAQGDGWGKCECGESNAGSGGGAGKAGSSSAGTMSGSAGAPDEKECSANDDCHDTKNPYCVDWTCVYRIPPNGDCGAAPGECAPGYVCTDISSEYPSEHDVVPQCRPG